jgi:hypothetical protein
MRYLSFLSLLISFQLSAQISWPPITNTTKPWTRWWWEGSAVNTKDLTRNLTQFQQAGLGGVEITPIYGVYGHEKEFIPFLTPQWMQMFDHTLAESKRLGLGVDLANATGWPFGGSWVTDSDASKTVYYKYYSVNAGEQLKEPVIYERQGFVRTANNKQVSADTLKSPVSANKNLQGLALDQIQYPGKIPMQALMAYSSNKVTNLTSKVDVNGKLNWTAPDGKWDLIAVFQGLHGKMVERAAPGGEGYAIDHFSLQAANNYFKKFDVAFKGHDLSYLRAFFNDSYEVDDAREQANWTPDFFTEFQKRKGYDLREQLLALFGGYDSLKRKRVVYDYRSVIDELLLEHFTIAWKKWGDTRGKMVRNQSHGSPANTLDLYSVVDIPETEGTEILRFKFATSAANVTGKKLVSSESATWLNEHFLSSLGDVKKIVDLFFLGGVNHIFYHGSEYSPENAPWPGWLFYAAVHFQPTNPQWKDFHTLNEYVARVQSFLQKGKPANDVLLYYPIIDRYSEPGNTLLQHFDGMERNFEHTEFEEVSKWMLEKGYSFDFFSDRQLKQITVRERSLVTGNNTYKAILLPANKLISEQSFQHLIDLAKQGAVILIDKHLPEDVPGFGNLEKRRTLFQQLVKQLSFSAVDNIQIAHIGQGTFVMGDDVGALLYTAGIDRESLASKGLSSLRRKNADGITWFINNRTEKPIQEWIELKDKAASVALFNPMTGKSGLANWRTSSRGFIEVYLQLESFESIIVQSFIAKKNGASYPYTEVTDQKQELGVKWDIEFLEGGPVLPSKQSGLNLQPWTSIGGNDEFNNFSGVARYSTSFPNPAGNAKSWLLDLGKVNETAEVVLNGKKIATLIGPVFQVVVPATAFQTNNKLEIIVANLMANRIAYMDRSNIPWKIFYNTNMPARRRENLKNGLFDAGAWNPLVSGLSGPVTITALK